MADHFGTFHIVSKCKQTPVQTYSQIRQVKTENISKFNNMLANADYSSILLADCPNYAYHSFMEMYRPTNAFNQACSVQSIKTPKKYIKREPWVTQLGSTATPRICRFSVVGVLHGDISSARIGTSALPHDESVLLDWHIASSEMSSRCAS